MINILVLLYINICLLFTFLVILYNNLINSDYGFVHLISLIIFVQFLLFFHSFKSQEILRREFVAWRMLIRSLRLS